MKFILIPLCFTSMLWAQGKDYGYLKPEDQKYYKNEALSGMNQLERIDSTVKEINKLHGEMAVMKAEIEILKKELEELKKAK